MEKVQTPPRQEERLRMSYEEFLAWADEDAHAEWVDGEVIIFMPPKTIHQDVTGFLHALLRFFIEFFKLGKILAAPYEMKFDPGKPAREPDILFISTKNLARLTEDRLEGPADLIVEIISDDSVSRDRSDKFYEYQEAGVREYWVIDPRSGKERADFWILDEDGRYRPEPIEEDGIYRSTVLPGFWLRVDWLWAGEMPDPLATLGQIIGPDKLIAALRGD